MMICKWKKYLIYVIGFVTTILVVITLISCNNNSGDYLGEVNGNKIPMSKLDDAYNNILDSYKEDALIDGQDPEEYLSITLNSMQTNVQEYKKNIKKDILELEKVNQMINKYGLNYSYTGDDAKQKTNKKEDTSLSDLFNNSTFMATDVVNDEIQVKKEFLKKELKDSFVSDYNISDDAKNRFIEDNKENFGGASIIKYLKFTSNDPNLNNQFQEILENAGNFDFEEFCTDVKSSYKNSSEYNDIFEFSSDIKLKEQDSAFTDYVNNLNKGDVVVYQSGNSLYYIKCYYKIDKDASLDDFSQIKDDCIFYVKDNVVRKILGVSALNFVDKELNSYSSKLY